jgi:hypothetical protein
MRTCYSLMKQGAINIIVQQYLLMAHKILSLSLYIFFLYKYTKHKHTNLYTRTQQTQIQMKMSIYTYINKRIYIN